MRTVLLFGTFDGLHEGHKYLFHEAKKLGDRLVVVLAPDEVVKRLKGRPVRHSYDERFATLIESGLVSEVISGDKVEGEYTMVPKIRPDLVVFGYDQEELARDFARYLSRSGKNIRTVTLAAFAPERYKSSLIG